MNALATSRRGVLGAMAVLPAVAIAAQAIVEAADDPVTRYLAAENAFNTGQIDEDEYKVALNDLDFWQPPTTHDFVRKYIAVYGDGGTPNERRAAAILQHARSLVG